MTNNTQKPNTTKNIPQTIQSDISTKDEFIRILSAKSGFTLSDTRVFLESLISIFEESMLYRLELHINGWLHLTHTLIRPRMGSKPTRGLKGSSEKIELGESTRSNLRLADSLRALSKLDNIESNDEE